MSKTIAERIEEAERKVDRAEAKVDDCQADLDEAESALEAAQEELEALEEEAEAPAREAEAKLDAAFIVDRTGPMRPAGDRPIRTMCALSEIPAAFGTAMIDGQLKGLSGSGAHWVTNGHFAIRVESNEGLTALCYDPSSLWGTPGELLCRDDEPGKAGSIDTRTFGGIAADLKYTSLIEDLFPGIEWHRCASDIEPIHAVVGGATVAVVMPCQTAVPS